MISVRDFNDHGSIVEDILTKGYSIMNLDTTESCCLIWENKFRDAFGLSDEKKIEAGKYRTISGLAVGYRKDDEREFIESRLLTRSAFQSDSAFYNDVSPSLPVSGYRDTAFNLIQVLR
jgi:hypothetical protein